MRHWKQWNLPTKCFASLRLTHIILVSRAAKLRSFKNTWRSGPVSRRLEKPFKKMFLMESTVIVVPQLAARVQTWWSFHTVIYTLTKLLTDLNKKQSSIYEREYRICKNIFLAYEKRCYMDGCTLYSDKNQVLSLRR